MASYFIKYSAEVDASREVAISNVTEVRCPFHMKIASETKKKYDKKHTLMEALAQRWYGLPVGSRTLLLT